MSTSTMTRYVRYEEISFLCPSGAGYREEAAMMRRARREVETGSLRWHEQVESVEVWGSEIYRPQAHQERSEKLSTRCLTLYWYRITITGTDN